jgi:hypothetical protein
VNIITAVKQLIFRLKPKPENGGKSKAFYPNEKDLIAINMIMDFVEKSLMDNEKNKDVRIQKLYLILFIIYLKEYECPVQAENKINNLFKEPISLKIDKIKSLLETFYIENSEGERYKLPEGTTLNGARVFARHVKNGGALHDDFGRHISKIVSEMKSLKTFVRNMRGRTFEDVETNQMVESAINYYGKLHRDLFTMRSQRGYEQYKNLWTPEADDVDEDIDLNELKERFVKKIFDDRLMNALPVVKKAYEADITNAGKEFESWAEGMIEDMSADVNTVSPTPKDMRSDDEFDTEVEDSSLTELLDKNNFA